MVVSNPLDVMCYVAMKVTGFPRERVLGMAGVLDTARYRAFLAEALDVSVRDIQAMVLGGHGDTMVPLISYTSVERHPGHPADRPRPSSTRSSTRTRNGGAEIVKHTSRPARRTTRPARPRCRWCEAIVLDQKRILPCAAWLEGEYGMRDVFCGVPCKLGRRGLERIIEVDADRRRAGGAAQERGGGARARPSWTRERGRI